MGPMRFVGRYLSVEILSLQHFLACHSLLSDKAQIFSGAFCEYGIKGGRLSGGPTKKTNYNLINVNYGICDLQGTAFYCCCQPQGLSPGSER